METAQAIMQGVVIAFMIAVVLAMIVLTWRFDRALHRLGRHPMAAPVAPIHFIKRGMKKARQLSAQEQAELREVRTKFVFTYVVGLICLAGALVLLAAASS